MKKDKFTNPINNPFPHYWIENFLTDEQYQKLIDMKNVSEFTAVGDSCRSSVSLGHSDYHEQITNGLIDENTKSTLIDVFWPSIVYQYPKATKDDVMKTAYVEGMIVKDVEGYEMEVLKGAKNILKKYNPIIAISIYHKKEHMFEIPEFLLEINDSYNFSITANNGTFIDMVLFAY